MRISLPSIVLLLGCSDPSPEPADIWQQRLERFTQADPQGPNSILAREYCDLALIYLRESRWEGAETCCRKALEFDPQYQPARALLERIQSRTIRGRDREIEPHR